MRALIATLFPVNPRSRRRICIGLMPIWWALASFGTAPDVGAADAGADSTFWKTHCANETKLPNDPVMLAKCINVGLANNFAELKQWLSLLEEDRRKNTGKIPEGWKSLFQENTENAAAAYFIANGKNQVFENQKIMSGIGVRLFDKWNETLVNSKEDPALQKEGFVLGVGMAQSRSMNVRIAEQLSQAAQKYTSINSNSGQTSDFYLNYILPNYCSRDLTHYAPGDDAKAFGLRNCLQNGNKPAAFANFDIMASSLLGPVRYNDGGLANAYAWLNHSNWTDLKKGWQQDPFNRFRIWSSNPQSFSYAARDFIQMVVGPSYEGLAMDKLFVTDPNSGQWVLTDKGKPYFLGMRQVAALRSLALNSFYHMYYDRYEDSAWDASDGQVNKLSSVLSVLEEEVNKRFGNMKQQYCMPVFPDNTSKRTYQGKFESERCKAISPALDNGQMYIDANWGDFVDSLTPELVSKEMAHMMALDLALRYKTYRQGERIEALLAAQLGVMAKQMESAVTAIAGVGQASAADIRSQFESAEASVSTSASGP